MTQNFYGGDYTVWKGDGDLANANCENKGTEQKTRNQERRVKTVTRGKVPRPRFSAWFPKQTPRQYCSLGPWLSGRREYEQVQMKETGAAFSP